MNAKRKTRVIEGKLAQIEREFERLQHEFEQLKEQAGTVAPPPPGVCPSCGRGGVPQETQSVYLPDGALLQSALEPLEDAIVPPCEL